ncbi:MAG: antibiotic biosynthesis monooxygenase family protein [Candidatus Limnocylindrales bacterium]
MIVRVLTATVRTERASTFDALMRQQLSSLRAQPGLVYVKLSRRIHNGLEEVILFEEWRDTAALYAWAGAELTRPQLISEAEELVEEVRVAHYEALDIEPEEE